MSAKIYDLDEYRKRKVHKIIYEVSENQRKWFEDMGLVCAEWNPEPYSKENTDNNDTDKAG